MRSCFLILLLCVTACAGSNSAPPSLLPRAAESIDPRVPVSGAVNDRPVSASLAARLADLVFQARAGDDAFRPLAERADQLATSAGPPQSESWTVAQEALSAAVAARGATTHALSDIDALGAQALQSAGGMSPADLAALKDASERVSAIEQRQAARLDAIQRRLGI
jgi:hypothetical protein